MPMGSEQASSLTAHVVARTFQFSKSHEWRAAGRPPVNSPTLGRFGFLHGWAFFIPNPCSQLSRPSES